MARVNIKDHRLQLITDRGLSVGGSSLDVVRAALSAGASWIQFREKDLYAGDFLQEGLVIRDAVISASAIFIVNDRVDMAMAMDAHGVHLGPNDLPLRKAKDLLGPDKIIGYSIKRPTDITPEICNIADYLGIGPIFHTTTKKVSNPRWGIRANLTHVTRTPIAGPPFGEDVFVASPAGHEPFDPSFSIATGGVLPD